MENTETTLRGWSSVWVYGTVVPDLTSNFKYNPKTAQLALAVGMELKTIQRGSILLQMALAYLLLSVDYLLSCNQ